MKSKLIGKLLLLCMFFLCSTTFYAQETAVEKTKKEVKKTSKKVADQTEKAAKKTSKEAKKVADKVEAKTEVKAAKTAKQAKAQTKTAVSKTKSKAKTETAKLRESNEKAPKVADKITGTYNGKKVYTGPRGGRYYINSNGNKTYIQD